MNAYFSDLIKDCAMKRARNTHQNISSFTSFNRSDLYCIDSVKDLSLSLPYNRGLSDYNLCRFRGISYHIMFSDEVLLHFDTNLFTSHHFEKKNNFLMN